MSDLDFTRDFGRLVRRRDPAINLAEAALLIARTEYPELDPATYLEHLDRLASQVDVDTTDPPLSNIQALNDFLFKKEKFSGNEEDYDDPRNSFLNDVLERKLGIPITLSLVYTELAIRRALPVVGVGFPGHFLAKYLTGSEDVIIDPYHGGKILSRQECLERLKNHFGEEAELKSEYLAASAPEQILARMLNNLKGSYFRRQNLGKVLTMIELALALNPGSPEDIRDRGMVYLAMKRHAEAMADFKTYLSLHAPDDPQVQDVRRALHRLRGLMN